MGETLGKPGTPTGFGQLVAAETCKRPGFLKIRPGYFVQWTSQGAVQFKQPKRVLGVSDDGEWAFVEGSNSGVPMSQLAATDPPPGVTAPITSPPASPFACGTPAHSVPLTVQKGDKSHFVVTIPKMDRAGYEFFKGQLDAFEDSIVTDED